MLPLIIIPTYNHGGTVVGIVQRCVELNLPVVVVDDGSTDGTSGTLRNWASENPTAPLTVVAHARNQGKAAALRSGFAHASAVGATHAITIDADGQLEPEDIPKLLAAAAAAPAALVLGQRPSRMSGCPDRCRLGRRLASLGVLAECGLRIDDTQSGLRIYPLELIRATRCRARRFAFEAEIITRAAWAGFDVIEEPIRCSYAGSEERISHWRPWRDSIGQAFTHGRLILRALAPFASRRYNGSTAITKKSALRRFLCSFSPLHLWREVRGQPIGDLELASGLAIGAFIGTLPCYGLHTVLCVYVAWRLHLQPVALVLGSQVSAGPLGIGLAAICISVGHLMLTGSPYALGGLEFTWPGLAAASGRLIIEWTIGSIIVGLGLAAGAFALGLIFARATRAKRQDVHGAT